MKWTIKPSINIAKEEVHIKTFLENEGIANHVFHESCMQISHEIYKIKEKAVREGLIALGWTPPAEKSTQHQN